MTRLGLSSYGVAWAIGVAGYPTLPQPLDHMGFMRAAAALGLQCVQFADNLPLHVLTASERAAVRDLAAHHDILIEVGTRGIGAENLNQYIELAHEFGSPILRVVVDTADHHPAPDEIVNLVRAQLPALRDRGVMLAIENHDRFKALTLADIVTALDDPHVGVCLDTVNSFGSLEGPDVVIETLGRFVVNLHVKDFTVRRADHNMGFVISGAAAGHGALDVPSLLDKLRGWGRSFNAQIETWLEPQADMAATVDLEAAMVRQSVDYLRHFIKD